MAQDKEVTVYHRYFPSPVEPEAEPKFTTSDSQHQQATQNKNTDDLDFGPLFSDVAPTDERTFDWLQGVVSNASTPPKDSTPTDADGWTKIRSRNRTRHEMNNNQKHKCSNLQSPIHQIRNVISVTHTSAKGEVQESRQRGNISDTNVVLNEALQERHRSPIFCEGSRQPGPSMKQEFTSTTPLIREYFQNAFGQRQHGQPFTWLDMPEVPSPDEVMISDPEATIPVNKVKGKWASKGEYLGAHYELVRADAVYPLRTAVQQIREHPGENENFFDNSIGIYERVHITSVICGARGIATTVTFSLGRVGKRVSWEQSKRLISGTLVALTSTSDMFQSKAILATVAARPLSGLNENPPKIDLYFARTEDMQIDPGAEWVMIEERSAYFEANRHVLGSLQKLATEGERFPLQNYLVDAQQDIDPPAYLRDNSHLDLSEAFSSTEQESVHSIDVLEDWPAKPKTTLDQSQVNALHTVLTKELAIIQGPPGTGKTYVSIVALQIMLAGWKPGDPPIVVSCQTNHALDQLLRHVATFEQDFVRLGGRSKDEGVVRDHTISNIRSKPKCKQQSRSKIGLSQKRIHVLAGRIEKLLSPIGLNIDGMPSPAAFRAHSLITEAQYQSLLRGDQNYVSHVEQDHTPLREWLGSHHVLSKKCTEPDDFGYDFEEAELDSEQLQDIEAEAHIDENDDCFEQLRGKRIYLEDSVISKRQSEITDSQIKDLLKQEDLWRIAPKSRGPVYNYLHQQLKGKLLVEFRHNATAYSKEVEERRIAGFERDFSIISGLKLVGLTTTGLSKYRPLLTALSPKVVLIEEAAETIEAPIIAACVPSLQHLILVGDHQQLRPQCSVQAFQLKPFYLNVSLFERMVMNEVEYCVLRKQRRMIPEIRRLLKPIYNDTIIDHPAVKNPNHRKPVPGLGGMNSFFFTHNWPESFDDNNSALNTKEADMVVAFFEYLVLNGVIAETITVLTFYNGQRNIIRRGLKRRPALRNNVFKVATVDSYQGEENDIVLLSLVRSNDRYSIGFLNVANRVCVALSRAKCGFYMFGNGELLCTESKLWHDVIHILIADEKDLNRRSKHSKHVEGASKAPQRRIGFLLPLTCQNHDHKTFVEQPDEFDTIPGGGCTIACHDVLPCGHQCKYTCHAFSHDSIACTKPCERVLSCGHICDTECGHECKRICNSCEKIEHERHAIGRRDIELPVRSLVKGANATSHQNTTYAWLEDDSSLAGSKMGKTGGAYRWQKAAAKPGLKEQRLRSEAELKMETAAYHDSTHMPAVSFNRQRTASHGKKIFDSMSITGSSGSNDRKLTDARNENLSDVPHLLDEDIEYDFKASASFEAGTGPLI